LRLEEASITASGRIDQPLLERKLQEIVEQTLRELEAGRLAVIDANWHLLGRKIGEPLLAKLIQSDMGALYNSFVPAFDKACRDALRLAGIDITSGSIRIEVAPRVRATIDDREAEIQQSLELRLRLVGGSSDRCFPFMLAHLSREMRKLNNRVTNRYESEIGQLEKQESQTRPSVAKKTIELAKCKSHVAARRLIVKQNPNLDAHGLCVLFDISSTPLTKRIKECETWEKAYKTPFRHAIDQLIYRDRHS
jgi:hypothetical protein